MRSLLSWKDLSRSECDTLKKVFSPGHTKTAIQVAQVHLAPKRPELPTSRWPLSAAKEKNMCKAIWYAFRITWTTTANDVKSFAMGIRKYNVD